MTARPADKPAPKDNNDRWDANEEPWRHPPVAPNDESAAKSLGRAVTDAVVTAADDDDAKDKTPPVPTPVAKP